jgi:hypothetical protein
MKDDNILWARYNRKTMKKNLTLFAGVFILILTGCTNSQPTVATIVPATEELDVQSTQTPTKQTFDVTTTPEFINDEADDIDATPSLLASPTITSGSVPATAILPDPEPTATLRPTLSPDEWKELPVVPEISDTVVQIYQHGLLLGNNPFAFSKVGDCGSTPAWFLGDFDRGSDFYNLGEYQYLQDVIRVFQGSFDRTSLAAKSGFNASSLFVTLWADRSQCESNETPLACEYRLHRPVIAFIMLGSNDIYHPDDFEPQMRKIIEFSIENGVVPVLSTKADNEEGDGSINAIIARLAVEYDIPLWNFWLAVQPLPDQGLQEDMVHLTWGRNFFDKTDVMEKAWPVRNLTALQVLDAVWRKVTGQT